MWGEKMPVSHAADWLEPVTIVGGQMLYLVPSHGDVSAVVDDFESESAFIFPDVDVRCLRVGELALQLDSLANFHGILLCSVDSLSDDEIHLVENARSLFARFRAVFWIAPKEIGARFARELPHTMSFIGDNLFEWTTDPARHPWTKTADGERA